MQHLQSRGLVSAIQDVIASGKPFLGICLGLQILFEHSEEGSEPGLGELLLELLNDFIQNLGLPFRTWAGITCS